jgi:hypothetical protein
MGFKVMLGGVVLWLVAAEGAALGRTVSVDVRPGGALVAGSRADLVVDASLPPGSPVLVTVRALGEAVEVLRGRLLGADGTVSEDGGLRFEVPLRARAAGSAELRVTVDGYACDPRCRDVHEEARVVVDVRAR